ncbi:MAG: SGNH/GDSL hydrolase family protein [Lachnospiraceae bacterium]|nr:SGNH/GDSL hydrolase family protein [Lachnospiraceae bacterium]
MVNFARLKRCMRRARQGGELTLGFFGGSITQDCAATVHENCYAYRVFRWWEKTFPAANFYYVNGGIGGTSSHFGAARAVSDLLMYQPDFVVVDFSVNDIENPLRQETYEGVLRQLLSWPSEPAVLLLNNIYYDTGYTDQDCHNELGGWYSLPHVSVGDTIYRRMLAGAFTREQLTADGLHPKDFGHGLIAAEITALLERVQQRMDEPEEDILLPAPMTANSYEHARRLTIREVSPALSGFRADAEEKAGHLDCFKNGWIGQRPGDSIRFEVVASCIAVQYRKTIHRPALSARLVLDGETFIFLDGNFTEDWGDCLYLEPVLHRGERKMHTVQITVTETQAEHPTPFYLLSLIIA